LAGRGAILISSSDTVDVFNYNRVEVHVIYDNHQLYPQLVDQIHQFNPTWTLVSEDRSFLCLAAALEASRSRVVYQSHSQATLPFGPECFLADPTKIELLQQAAGIITISTYLRDYIRRWSGLEATTIPLPVFGSGPFPRFENFDRGFVTMINPSGIKGISIFLELARRLPDAQFAAVPTWATTNADRVALERTANVTLLRPVEDIDEIFAQTRVLVVPSLWGESFGYIVIEAMLRGIPVVASNVGGLPEAKLGVDYLIPVNPIEHYEENLDEQLLPVPEVPDQDVGQWVKSLQELLSSSEDYERVSATSRKASLRYISTLRTTPVEKFLKDLTPARGDATYARTPVRFEQDNETTSDFTELLENLSPARLELLAMMLSTENSKDNHRIPKLPRKEDSDSFPLSFAQQRLWFLDQLEPNNPFYNMSQAVRLSGVLGVQTLERTLQTILSRHESLRTTFVIVDGNPVQVISKNAEVEMPVIDLSRLREGLREAEAQVLIRQCATRPFDLTEGPLFRASLLKLSEAEHILLLTMHHIISDGWSKQILFREIGALYEAFTEGKPSPLPELTIQYADYAVWQRRWLQGEVLEKQLSYWREQLQGAPAVLGLPTDRPRPAVQTYRGASQSIVLSKDLSEQLKELSRKENVTLYMTLLAAFQTLLSRYSGQEDVVVGSPIAGRNQTETEGLIGFFINTLALRTDMRGNPTFRDLLAQVREKALGAYAHQDVPFEKLVRELQLERSLSHNPLIQVWFVMQNAQTQEIELSDLTLHPMGVDSGRVRHDLRVSLWDTPDGLQCWFAYNTDLFDTATIVRMIGHFETLLHGIVAQPDARLNSLEMISGGERDQRRMGKRTRDASQLEKLRRIRRKAIDLSVSNR
jgi:glycosyltransferase involved in cell wall biosynthesis